MTRGEGSLVHVSLFSNLAAAGAEHISIFAMYAEALSIRGIVLLFGTS